MKDPITHWDQPDTGVSSSALLAGLLLTAFAIGIMVAAIYYYLTT